MLRHTFAALVAVTAFGLLAGQADAQWGYSYPTTTYPSYTSWYAPTTSYTGYSSYCPTGNCGSYAAPRATYTVPRATSYSAPCYGPNCNTSAYGNCPNGQCSPCPNGNCSTSYYGSYYPGYSNGTYSAPSYSNSYAPQYNAGSYYSNYPSNGYRAVTPAYNAGYSRPNPFFE